MSFNKFSMIVALLLLMVINTGCKMSYSLSGASIPPEAKSVSISYFNNNATMVAPLLSPTLTDGLQQRFARQTSLEQVKEGGDLSFEGEITNYTAVPTAVTSEEVSALYRLTVTVRVKYTSALEPQYNYNKTFTAFVDYNANSLLTEVEPQLIPELVDILVEDIFNAAVSNW